MKISRFPANTKGRDLVVGDIHGHLDDLGELLKQAAFKPKVDRVFCTGDLVDRGPDSMKCLGLLRQPWFHSVAGNHEYALIKNINDLIDIGAPRVREIREEAEALLNEKNMGAGWLARAYLRLPGRRHWDGVIKLIDSMPNLIVVGEGTGRFHIVHGGLYLSQTVIDDRTVDRLGEYIERGAFSKEALETMRESVTWHRTIAEIVQEGWACEKMHDGLSITFCGHNIVARPTLALSHFHIDTGCGSQQRLGRKEFGLTLAIVEDGFPVKTLTTKEKKA